MNEKSRTTPANDDSKDAASAGESAATQAAQDATAPADATAAEDASKAAEDSGATEGGEDILPPDMADEADAPDLAQEIADLKDQLLRSLAEADNIRKRAQREREDAAKYAVSGFAKDLLGVADNLQRALESLPDDLAESDDRIKAMVDGVGMTERELLNVFERHGLTKISPLGEKFDHDYHQALFEVPDSDAEAGTVVQLVAPGYLLNGRLLRPAMVGVAKAGGTDEKNGKDDPAPDAPKVDTSV